MSDVCASVKISDVRNMNMVSYNDCQKEMIRSRGLTVVDAGPGTGKTHTIVGRYSDLIWDGAQPEDILMLTFTRSAAREMDSRLKRGIVDIRPENYDDMSDEEKKELDGIIAERERMKPRIQCRTFDSFCMSIVKEGAETISSVFGVSERITRTASFVENGSLILDHFRMVLDRFLTRTGGSDPRYGSYPTVIGKHPGDVFDLISRLMSKGIYPVSDRWCGDVGNVFEGEVEKLRELCIEGDRVRYCKNGKPDGRWKSRTIKMVEKALKDSDSFQRIPTQFGSETERMAIIDDVFNENRTPLFNLIHDVYLEYIRTSIRDNRLTYGLNALFAYLLLYTSPEIRRVHSYRYVMIDEFQDTNTNQLAISLMILDASAGNPDLCVVGDWKQGIYGFRYVSIENIARFQMKVQELESFLNTEGETRVHLSVTGEVPKVNEIGFVENFRSSELVIHEYFNCLALSGDNDEVLDLRYLDSDGEEIPGPVSNRDLLEVVMAETGKSSSGGSTYYTECTKDTPKVRLLKSMQSDLDVDGRTEIRYIPCDDELNAVAMCICDYVSNPIYRVRKYSFVGGVKSHSDDKVKYGDIAVLCRNVKPGRAVSEYLNNLGIPATFFGEEEVFNRTEGILLLAWLKLLINERDWSAIVPVLDYYGYSLNEISTLMRKKIVPDCILSPLRDLRETRRLVEVLSYVFKMYGFENDYTQSITTVLSDYFGSDSLSLSDVVSFVDEAIANNTAFPVDHVVEEDCVTVMTMHKSKGLEFPVVIIPFMDKGKMPTSEQNKSVFYLDPLLGVRCKEEIGSFNDEDPVLCKSWNTFFVEDLREIDRLEEKRLMFVAMSRAKQYISILYGVNKPSRYLRNKTRSCLLDWHRDDLFKKLGDSANVLELTGTSPVPKAELPMITPPGAIATPDLSPPENQLVRYGVHDLMSFYAPDGKSQVSDESGMAFGSRIHAFAEQKLRGTFTETDLTDKERTVLSRVDSVIESLSGASRLIPEITCVVPFPDENTVLTGVIDLLAVFDDHVEIHDYKTDSECSDLQLHEYEFQLSVYAVAVSAQYGLPVSCYLDFVSQEQVRVPVTICDRTEIIERIRRRNA